MATLLCLACLFRVHYSRYFQSDNVVKPCTLPKIDFYDQTLDDVFWHVPTVKCDYWDDFVFFDKKGALRINETAVITSGYTNLTCGFSGLDFGSDLNDLYVSETKLFTLPTYTHFEFVHVKCFISDGTAIYSNILFKIVNTSEVRNKQLRSETNDQLSIMFLGLDSVSRLVAERKLSLTLNYIEDKLGAYVMNGYTKVGDNTLPNLIAVMLGKTVPEAAVPTFEHPEIYRDIMKRGYIDCYSEDWASYIPYLGFKFPRYTHYIRKLFLANKRIMTFMKGKLTKNEPCIGNRLQFKMLMDYSQACVDSYRNKLKYIFMWQNELGHWQSNNVQMVDQYIADFLYRLNETNSLQRTVVILFGDHGPRYGHALESDIGRFTGRLPLLAMLLPEQLKHRYPHIHQNLLQNKDRLTTPFDLHETIVDIVKQRYSLRKDNYKSLPRGISLFQSIPRERSCYDAGISEHYCPCYSFSNVSTQGKEVNDVSNFVLHKINHFLLKEKDKCAKLQLSNIISAKIQHNPKQDSVTERSTNYVVVLETLPGHGRFEATAQHYSSSKINILGDINRLNMYGNQSICITDHFLHLYCYCNYE